MVSRALTLMAVHAHPDDEASGTGGVLARYAAEGVQTVLVTCTDGGCGDGPGGVKPGEPGHDPAAVVAVRRAELEASCAILGVTHLETLDYADSGMMGWPTNDAPGSLWTTPVEVAAARLAQLIDHYQPDVVVTYDEIGFYGHPDHIQAHRITMAAMRSTGSSAKLYWITIPHTMLEKFGALIRELGGDSSETGDGTEAPTPEQDELGEVDGRPMGLPDDEISTWVDTRPFSGQKFDALAAHASQGENIFFLQMGRARFAEYMGIETFVRIDGDTPATPIVHEDDLFAGLRP